MASFWRWTGSASNDPNNSSNWLLVSGPGNALGLPASGDNATVDTGGLIAGKTTVLAASAFTNDGTIESLGGTGGYTLTLEIAGSLSGTGTLEIGNGSIMKLDSIVPTTQTVSFNPGGAAILILAAPQPTIAAPITGLSIGDRIEFGGVASISGIAIAPNGPSSDTLTVTTNIGNIVLSDVSFATAATPFFYYNQDTNTGFWQIVVAAPGVTWTGAASSDLGTGGNWSPSGVPTTAEGLNFSGAGGTLTGSVSGLAANFSGAAPWVLQGTLNLAGQPSPPYGPYAVNFSAPSVVVDGGTITASGGGGVNSAAVGGATLTIQNGGEVTLWATYVGNGPGQTGHLLVTGSGTALTNLAGTAASGPAGYLLVGEDGAGDATITNDATVTDAANDVVGGQTGVGTLTVSAGGTLTDHGLSVGSSGTGTLNVQAGGVVTDNGTYTFAGSNAGSVGTINVTGAGALLTGSAEFIVGNFGTGTATVGNGGTIAAGSTSTSTQSIAVGQLSGSHGTLTINAGGTVTGTGTATVGNTAGSDGTLTINAGGSMTLTGAAITNGDVFVIGGNGAGTDSSGNPIPASHGAVLITGAGASLNLGLDAHGNGQNALGIGGRTGGTGELTVAQGASLTVGSTANGLAALLFAEFTGDVANVTLTDAGTQVNATGPVTVGRGGQATMTIENGAALRIKDLSAGVSGMNVGRGRVTGTDVGGSGIVTVTTGGLLDLNSTTSSLGIGGNGVNGTLIVDDGGVVNTGNRFVVGTATEYGGVVYGGTGTVTVGAGGTIRLTAPPPSGVTAMVIGGADPSVGGTTTLSSGFVTVTGTGALLDTSGYSLAVGGLSLGTLTVNSDGVVDAGNTAIAGSSAGTLSIASGGAVNVTGTFGVGINAGSTGIVDVEGASTLTASGDITIGELGTGALTVGAGAKVQSTTGGVTIGATGTLTLTGGTIDPPGTITNDGAIGGQGSVEGDLVNDSTVNATGGVSAALLDVAGDVSGSGTFTIATGGILEFDGVVGAGQAVDFTDTTGKLDIEALTIFHAAVSGFRPNDVIHVAGVDGGSLSGTTLTLTHGGTTVGTLSLTGIGGTPLNPSDITVSTAGDVTACFAEGVRILTDRGEVAVEDLAAGDVVLTRFGGPMPIRWIGRRTVHCGRHPERWKIDPIVIRAGAFAANVPHRDLRLSPDHAVYLPEEQALVPAKHLVNGTSIVQTPVATVTYFHIELDEHDVVLADGLPTESFLPNGDRSMFDNGGAPVRLHPDFHALTWAADGCAPLIVTGPELDAARTRLRRIAAEHVSAAA